MREALGIWTLATLSILQFGEVAFGRRVRVPACQNDEYKGMYLPYESVGLRCCNERRIIGPIISREIIEECQLNVTRDNDNDDLPALISKSEACIDKHEMGDEITFKKFVEYNLKNYTNESNTRQTILDANKECSEGDKETELYKKLDAYHWCLIKNEESVCNKPANSTKELRLNRTFPKVNRTCPELPQGVSQSLHCCLGKATRTPWANWARQILSPKEQTPNSKKEECESALRSIFKVNQTIRDRYPAQSAEYLDDFIEVNWDIACLYNPVIFENGTLGPEIGWNFDDILKKNVNKRNLNKKMLTELTDRSLKMKTTLKLSVRNRDRGTETGKTFVEIEQMYKEATDFYSRAALYSIYYEKMLILPYLGLRECCGLEPVSKI